MDDFATELAREIWVYMNETYGIDIDIEDIEIIINSMPKEY